MGKQQRNSETNAAQPRSGERLEKLNLLQTCQALFSKDLSDEESSFWAKMLEAIPLHLLRQAFENWQRNGRFFPKPKEILDLIESYKVTNQLKFKSCGKCDDDGWKVVTEGVKWRNIKGELVPMKPGNKAVTRCECWIAWRQGQAA